MLEQVCLLLVGFGRNDEMLRDNGILVQDQNVRWIMNRQLGDEEILRRVLERVRLLVRRGFRGIRFGLLCESGTVAELELCDS